MIVILREELFEGDDTDDMTLIVLIERGRERCKVRLDPTYEPDGKTAFYVWLEEQSQMLQEQIRFVLQNGLLEPDFADEPTVVVERREAPIWPDNFAQGEARLPPNVARALLERPLRLLLENGRNDWSFLGKVIPEGWRRRWDRATSQGWIEPQNAGGITEIPNVVNRLVDEGHPHRLRLWVMFDSDGRAPGHRSRQAADAVESCEDWSVPYHLLERRAIESYLPKSALFDWAARRSTEVLRRQKREDVEAYCAMTPPQRHHYNLKEGFAKDTESHNELEEAVRGAVEALYPAPLRDAAGPLFHGFHRSLGQDLWGDDPDKKPHEVYLIAEEALVAEGFEQERARLAQAIFGML